MDMYGTDEEEILMRQGLRKSAEDPSYRLQPPELVAITCVFLRSRALLIEPKEVTFTLNVQNDYVQKIIRRHGANLRMALGRGMPEFLAELNRHGLHQNLVTPGVVEDCLLELENEKNIREKLGYAHGDLTAEQQLMELDLMLINPDRKRGQYVGPVVCLDHRSAMVKFANGKAIELLFDDLAVGQERPRRGGTVRMKFKDEDLEVSF